MRLRSMLPVPFLIQTFQHDGFEILANRAAMLGQYRPPPVRTADPVDCAGNLAEQAFPRIAAFGGKHRPGHRRTLKGRASAMRAVLRMLGGQADCAFRMRIGADQE